MLPVSCPSCGSRLRSLKDKRFLWELYSDLERVMIDVPDLTDPDNIRAIREGTWNFDGKIISRHLSRHEMLGYLDYEGHTSKMRLCCRRSILTPTIITKASSTKGIIGVLGDPKFQESTQNIVQVVASVSHPSILRELAGKDPKDYRVPSKLADKIVSVPSVIRPTRVVCEHAAPRKYSEKVKTPMIEETEEIEEQEVSQPMRNQVLELTRRIAGESKTSIDVLDELERLAL